VQQPMQVFGALRGQPESGASQPTALPPVPGFLRSGRLGEDQGADPVFVFSTARSGSTLTRFLLDAHPELACPPETGLPELCARLARMWTLLAAGQLPDESMEVPDPVIAGIRHTVDLIVGPYLASHGKQRYCEKTMEAAKHTDLLLRVFPRAKFVCLYRHPMDVITSVLEACPWGLKGLGLEFDSYTASSPGNSVLALARYWADSTARTMAVEDKFPERCHRVRYEDLVVDPETTASRIFEFIGVPPAAGISTGCFTTDRQRFGPADFKIWNTSKITTDSVGRGWSVPAYQIDPPTTARLNELADRLGYVRIERSWGGGPAPVDLRVSVGEHAAPPPASPPGATRQLSRALLQLGDLLQAGLFRISDRFVRQWEPCSADTFMIIGTSTDDAGASARWRVDLAAKIVSLASAGQAEQNGSATWQIVGCAEAWEKVLSGRANLGVLLRQRELRYCDTGEARSVGLRRIAMLTDLLGLTSWRTSQPRPSVGSEPVTFA